MGRSKAEKFAISRRRILAGRIALPRARERVREVPRDGDSRGPLDLIPFRAVQPRASRRRDVKSNLLSNLDAIRERKSIAT